MDDVQVDVQDGRRAGILVGHDMVGPDIFKECASGSQDASSSGAIDIGVRIYARGAMSYQKFLFFLPRSVLQPVHAAPHASADLLNRVFKVSIHPALEFWHTRLVFGQPVTRKGTILNLCQNGFHGGA